MSKNDAGPPSTLRVAIVGSRDFPYLNEVAALVARLARWSSRTGRPVVIVSGTDPEHSSRTGVDQQAILEARSRGLETVVHAADWRTHGKAAGPLRNTRIVEDADYVVAFWWRASRGTADAIRKAIAAGKLAKVYGEQRVMSEAEVRAALG